MPDKPTFAQYKNQDKPEQPVPPDFTEDELDAIYTQLSTPVRQTIDEAVTEALARENFTNVRPGSRTWLRVQRQVIQSKLVESVQREEESGLGI